MTHENYINKLQELKKLKKRYKHLVIHEDSAIKVNNIKELIAKMDGEIKAYDKRTGYASSEKK